jgi:hypothetical protein
MYYLYLGDWDYYYGISPVLDDDEVSVLADQWEAQAHSPDGAWYDYGSGDTFQVYVGPCSSSSSSSKW